MTLDPRQDCCEMDPFAVVGIAFGLAMDAFSVAVAAGGSLKTVTNRQAFRLSYHFGWFQFMMPLIGWLAGVSVAGLIGSFDHWISFALLAYVGGKMIWESIADREEGMKGDPTKGFALIALSVATSIDALAVGLSLGLLRNPVLVPALVIGVVAGGMTLLGLRIGQLAGMALGPWMERIGGVVLIGIGLRIVIEHTIGA